eukprot:16447467-Heterocapsa_arctica.AAC.1
MCYKSAPSHILRAASDKVPQPGPWKQPGGSWADGGPKQSKGKDDPMQKKLDAMQKRIDQLTAGTQEEAPEPDESIDIGKLQAAFAACSLALGPEHPYSLDFSAQVTAAKK